MPLNVRNRGLIELPGKKGHSLNHGMRSQTPEILMIPYQQQNLAKNHSHSYFDGAGLGNYPQPQQRSHLPRHVFKIDKWQLTGTL